MTPSADRRTAPTCPNCRALLPPGSPGAVVACAVCHAQTRLPAPVAVLVSPDAAGAAAAPAAVPVAAPAASGLPPINYCCPTCQARLQAEASAAGSKRFCSRCGQKLLIPQSPRPVPVNRTVLGRLEPSPEPVGLPPLPDTDHPNIKPLISRSAERLLPPAIPDDPNVKPFTSRSEERPPSPRRRKAWSGWAKGLLIAAGLGAVTLGLWLVFLSPSEPTTATKGRQPVSFERLLKYKGASMDEVRRVFGEPDRVADSWSEYGGTNYLWSYGNHTVYFDRHNRVFSVDGQ
jgi:hypothetical protein